MSRSFFNTNESGVAVSIKEKTEKLRAKEQDVHRQIKMVERELTESQTRQRICAYRVKNVDFNRETLLHRVHNFEKKLSQIQSEHKRKRLQLVQVLEFVEETETKLEKLQGEKNANLEIKKDKKNKLPENELKLEAVKADLIKANIKKKALQREKSKCVEETNRADDILEEYTQEIAEHKANEDMEKIKEFEEKITTKRGDKCRLQNQMEAINQKLEENDSWRVRYQHQREHLKEQSDLFRSMTEEIDRAYSDLIEQEHRYTSEKARLDDESNKLAHQVAKVGRTVESIKEDIVAVRNALNELSRKKAVFSLELHAALEEDKQLTEKLKNLRREQESIKTRTSELFGRNSTTVQSPSIDIDSLFTTLTANVYRVDGDLKQLGIITVSTDLIQFLPEDPVYHCESVLHEISEIKESEFNARAEKPTLTLYFERHAKPLKFTNDPERLALIHELFRNYVSEKERNYNFDDDKNAPRPAHYDIEVEQDLEHCICTEEEMQKLIYESPPRLHAFPWKRLYAAAIDGISIQTFYGICKENDVNDSIILIKDGNKQLLGSFACCMWVSSTGYYGNNDTFVFNMVDGYWKTYHASGNNRYYQFSDESHLSVGEGTCPAIHLDGNLKDGFTHDCGTFCSPILVDPSDFEVLGLELWAPCYD